MIDLEKILIVIPARGGSKRIPDKNIKNIASKPMIHWPLNELLKVSNYVEYNTKLVSLIASPSAMSIMSDSPGAY